MRRQSLLIQLGVGAVLMAGLGVLINNLTVNLIRTGIDLGFDWLKQPAGFALAETALPYAPSDSYLWALLVGWLNSLKVILAGLVLATVLGITAGAARISSNRLLRSLAGSYVAVIRQVPLLLQLLFWYFVAFLGLPDTGLGGLIKLSNQGIHLLGLNLSVEFCAILTGLTVFTGASIAEIVRGGINAVPEVNGRPSGVWGSVKAWACAGSSCPRPCRRSGLPSPVSTSTWRRTAPWPSLWATPISMPSVIRPSPRPAMPLKASCCWC